MAYKWRELGTEAGIVTTLTGMKEAFVPLVSN